MHLRTISPVLWWLCILYILNIALINSCTTTACIIVLLLSECVIRVWGEGDPGDISKYTQQRDNEPPPPDNHGTHATEASLGQQTNRVLQIQASVRRVSRSLSLLNLRSSWCCWGCIPFLMSHKCGFVVNDTLGLVSRQILIINVHSLNRETRKRSFCNRHPKCLLCCSFSFAWQLWKIRAPN